MERGIDDVRAMLVATDFSKKSIKEAKKNDVELKKINYRIKEGVEEKTPPPCCLAIAVYGTTKNSELDDLRCFRDNVLRKNKFGKFIISFYYWISFHLSGFVAKNKVLRFMVYAFVFYPAIKLLSR